MPQRWYIVHAYTNFERKVAEAIKERAKAAGLEELFEQIIVPTEEIVEVKRGRKVTIVDSAETAMGEGLSENNRIRLLWWLSKKGTAMLTGVQYEAITDEGLITVTQEGERQTIEADTIIPAIPLTPNTELVKSLEGKVPEIYAIGDGREPRLIIDAIADGSRIAHAI